MFADLWTGDGDTLSGETRNVHGPLAAGVPGAVHAAWSPARRANRYRIYKKEAGDAEFQATATTTGLEATISGLKPGAAVEIQVAAANDAGESLPSDPAQIVVPPEHARSAQA